MKKDFQKWHNKAKTAPLRSGFAVHLPPGRLLPNFISGLGAWEALLGLAKFGVDFFEHNAISPKKSELWPSSAGNRSLYKYNTFLFDYAQ